MFPKKIDANVSLSYVSGVIAYYQADYELAEQHLQDGLHELKKMMKSRRWIIIIL